MAAESSESVLACTAGGSGSSVFACRACRARETTGACSTHSGKLLVHTTFGARSIPQKCFTQYQGMQSSPCLAVRRSQVGRPCHPCRPCPLTPAARTQKQAHRLDGRHARRAGHRWHCGPAHQRQLHIIPVPSATPPNTSDKCDRLYGDSQANGGSIPNKSKQKTPMTHPKRLPDQPNQGLHSDRACRPCRPCRPCQQRRQVQPLPVSPSRLLGRVCRQCRAFQQLLRRITEISATNAQTTRSSERANESIQHDKRHWCNAYPARSPFPLQQRAAFTWSSWRTILAVQTVLALGAVVAGHSILAGRPWLTVCAVLAGRTHDTRYAYQSMQLHPTTCQSCHPSWRRIVHKCVHGRELTLRADFAGDAILARRALPARGAVGAGGTRCALSACRAEKIAAAYSSPHKYFPLCMRIQCTASKPSH